MNKTIAKFSFYFVAGVVLLWTATLTYKFVSKALPNLGFMVPLFSLIVFDVGMLAWLFVFIHYAEGSGQRAVAIVACIFDLVGVSLMVIAEILLDGQTMVTAPEWLAGAAIWAIAIWTIGNVVAVVAFHLLDPDAQQEMKMRDVQDSIKELAFKELRVQAAGIAQDAARLLGAEMLADVTNSLGASTENGRNNALPLVATQQPEVAIMAATVATPNPESDANFTQPPM